MVFEKFVPDADDSPDVMLSYQGYPVLHYGSINTYSLVNASDDAHNYAIAGSGYSDDYNNVNAAAALGDTNATARSNGYRAPVEGMQAVPEKLKEKFVELNGRYIS
jgi:hypothetical protein